MFAELCEVWEGGHENQTGSAIAHQFFQLKDSLGRHGAVRSDRLDEKKPVSRGVVKYDIREFPVLGNGDFKLRQAPFINVQVFSSRITNVKQLSARCKPRPKLGDDGSLQDIVFPRR